MHEAVNALRDFGRLSDLISAEILSGTNEKAMEILRVCGCSSVIPGTVYVPVSEVARFYGVTQTYVKGVFGRHGIVRQKTPKDVIRQNVMNFLSSQGVRDNFAVSSLFNNEWILCNAASHQQLRFMHCKASSFYSARAVLAFAALMYYGKRVNPESPGNSVYQVLLNSTYGDEARKIFEQRAEARRRRNLEEFRAAQSAEEPARAEGAVINDDGKIVLTPEFFAGIIKTAVYEAVSEYAGVISGKQAGRATRARNPGNSGSSSVDRPKEAAITS